MPDFIGITSANERQKEFENERRNRGFIPDSLVDRLVMKSMMGGEDVVDLWLGFVDFIRDHWDVDDWTLWDNDILEDWFESYAIGR
jgi:hypothetical protein|tara:strand:- start:439 stop:696 length:258 start_codon:yes stop_codon:yes gene_type:complete